MRGDTLLALALASVSFGCTDPACDPGAIADALAAAAPGDTVSIGECTVTGDFTVPAGVTLVGLGPDRSRIASAGMVALTIETRDGRTSAVRELAVHSDGCAAIVARGDGALSMRAVRVDTPSGIGLGAEGLASLELEDVQTLGPIEAGISPGRVQLPPYACDPAMPATHGIVLVRVADARLTTVDTIGYAAFGALLVESHTTWRAGLLADHIGTGLAVVGGDAELTDLELRGARQDVAPVESFNAVFLDAAIQSAGLLVTDGEVFGLFQQGGSTEHEDLTVRSNGFAGVWAQSADALRISGAMSRITDNGFAGVAAYTTGMLAVSDATIGTTRDGIAIDGARVVHAADGIHAVGVSAAELARLQLDDNERVGLLVDLAGGSTDALTLSAIAVAGTGSELGAVAQNGTVAAGWDVAIARDAITMANDVAFSGTLDVTSVVGPSCLPVVDAVVASGLSSLVP
ncbi:MAG: hypothetical protein AB7S26_11460 [Sandaracinaceae bacterium]